jgi:GH25 family lysozyme M1 (1,4-beta-N-acetylmuramidase)
VDVSKWQHPHHAMNWRALSHAAPGFAFTFVKASAGNHARAREANPWHRRDAAAAKSAGAYVGSYHYAVPARPVVRNARREAVKAVRAAGVPRAGDLPLALDLESNPHHLSRRQMARWALTWLRAVERRIGHAPVLYTYPSYFAAHVAPERAFRRYPLWIAHYGSGLKAPTVPKPWSRWTFWQHSSQGRLPGVATDVDLNVFAGSKSQLASLAGVTRSRRA